MMAIRYYKDLQGQAPLTEWIDDLKDIRSRTQVRVRLMRLADGNLGHCKPLRDGVQQRGKP